MLVTVIQSWAGEVMVLQHCMYMFRIALAGSE